MVPCAPCAKELNWNEQLNSRGQTPPLIPFIPRGWDAAFYLVMEEKLKLKPNRLLPQFRLDFSHFVDLGPCFLFGLVLANPLRRE